MSIDFLMPGDNYLTSRTTNVLVCGYCNLPKDETYELSCIQGDTCFLSDDLENRVITWDDVRTFHQDYYLDSTLVLEESNVEATNITKSEEWDGIFANRERDFTGRYDDLEPNRCTHAKSGRNYFTGEVVRGWWTNTTQGHYTDNHLPNPMRIRNKKTGEYSRVEFTEASGYNTTSDSLDFEDPRLMRLEFNELQGFVSSRLIDLEVTEAYNKRFFNIFVGNYDNKLHVGSCVISRSVDERVQAQCTRKDCKAILIAPHFDDITRQDMETFIHAVIRHGNNHGPDFIRTREDFAYIHAETCDTNHSWSQPCNITTSYRSFRDITDLMGTDEILDFLIHHRKTCTASDCRCTHYYHLINERNYANV